MLILVGQTSITAILKIQNTAQSLSQNLACITSSNIKNHSPWIPKTWEIYYPQWYQILNLPELLTGKLQICRENHGIQLRSI